MYFLDLSPQVCLKVYSALAPFHVGGYGGYGGGAAGLFPGLGQKAANRGNVG